MRKEQKNKLILKQIPILYHGTDERILSMSAEKRKAFHADCKAIADALWPFFEPNVLGQETLIGEDGEMMERERIEMYRKRFSSIEGYRRFVLSVSIYYRSHHLEDTLFDHDALYLTSFRDAADRYAVRAGYFGEIGFVAYHLSLAARLCQYTIKDSTIASKVDMLIDFAESDHHPVVVEITSYDPDLLRAERGEELHIERGWVRESMFRYLGEIDLKEYNHSQARTALSII